MPLDLIGRMSVSLRNLSQCFTSRTVPQRLASSQKQFPRYCTIPCQRIKKFNRSVHAQKFSQACQHSASLSCDQSSKPTPLSPILTQQEQSYDRSSSTRAMHMTSIFSDNTPSSKVVLSVNGKDHEFSAVFLRDLCECPACVHESTKQKLYSTTDIPANIQDRCISPSRAVPDAVDILWSNDVPGFGANHTTTLTISTLQAVVRTGAALGSISSAPSSSVLWNSQSDRFSDFEYQAYMNSDDTLLAAIEQLQTHGLAFVTGVPAIEESVAAIAERIGPVKDTFYGRTWDVRTVPKAINAAYTSNDLGFHTDLLYFDNPPHIQLLHCIQSSSSGGASVFADAFKCALDLYEMDMEAFDTLATLPVNYHYKHPDSNMYSTTKPVFDLRPLRVGATTYNTVKEYLDAHKAYRKSLEQTVGLEIDPITLVDCLEKINWGPPFMAPFSLPAKALEHSKVSVREALNNYVDKWHAAAKKFSTLLERPGVLHERLMKPGVCVLFNNTRVLHSRRAFSANDVGKARWLRGTYVDKDPFFSKLKVLTYKAQRTTSSALL